MSKNIRTINFALRPVEKNKFFDKCKANSINPSGLLRNCVAAYLDDRLVIKPREEKKP